LTSIPAIAGRMLATPCAWGRISVTVEFAFTGYTKQWPCHRRVYSRINGLDALSYRAGRTK
jgi:hypothetical protein